MKRRLWMVLLALVAFFLVGAIVLVLLRPLPDITPVEKTITIQPQKSITP